MREVSFTFDWYAELLESLRVAGYSFADFHQPIDEGTAIMRHDVDWSPRKAVRLAEIEAERGISSTYLFLTTSPFYNVHEQNVRETIKELADLGHEIGLHFSTHQYFDSTPNGESGEQPSLDALENAVDDEREVLGLAAGRPIDVVSFHNPPEWVFRQSFDGFVSTYEERFFEEIAYLADSNQRWRTDQPFDGELPPKIQLLTHPVLWGDRDGFAVDRLREERDYLLRRISGHIESTDRTWDGVFGFE